MKTIEIIFIASAILTFIGILGLPFGSLTLFGIFSLKENVWDNLKYYGLKNFRQWDFVRVGRGETLFYGIFPIATVLCLTLFVPYCNFRTDEAMPNVPGYYAKVVSVGKKFQTKDNEVITEATISFGSGPERKAILSGWYGSSIVLVTNENSCYYNWSRGAKIVPQPLAWL